MLPSTHCLKIACSTAFPSLQPELQALAKRLSLPIAQAGDPKPDYLVLLSPEGLGLQANTPKAPLIQVDFVGGSVGHRRQAAFNEPLVKVFKINRHDPPTVLDATAGLGTDTFMLATLGCKVTALERHPVVLALLEDGLSRAAQHPHLRPIVDNITLVKNDSRDFFLTSVPKAPDIVYCDPMFPERTKTALVKKGMQALQSIVGHDDDAQELVELARQLAKKRVIVKRPKKAPYLSSDSPNLQFIYSRCRFDVYLSTKT